MDGGAWQATIHGVRRVRHSLATTPPPPPPKITQRAHYCFKAVILES